MQPTPVHPAQAPVQDAAATRRIAERFSRLTPEQRAVVYRKIQAEGLTIGQFPVLAREERHRGKCPLSYAQQRQWFLWKLDPQSTAYHLSGALRLRGDLDEAAVRASFEALVARHEALRTVFRADEQGLAEQVVLATPQEAGFAVRVVALDETASGQEAREAQVRRLADRISQAPFDLGQGPLLRVGLVRVGPGDHLLVLVMHHIVSDGWSLRILIEEFAAQYRARVEGREATLAPLPIQYADHAVWQRHWLEAGENQRQLAYWQAQLGGEHPVLQLPTDHARTPQPSHTAATHAFELPEALGAAVRRFAQDEGATVFMVLLAAWQGLLGRYTGQADIRVGVPVANRHRVETEGVVGFFVNTQVLRCQLPLRTTLRQLLAQAKQAALGAQAHQDLPFEQLVQALQPERSLSASPLFQVMFNHQRRGHGALQQLPGLEVKDQPLGEKAAQFELTLDTTEDHTPGQGPGRLHGRLTYASELFEAGAIGRMAGHYVALLEALVREPERVLADVELPDAQEALQLRRCSVNPAVHGAPVPVHQLIEAQAARQPDAVALVFGEEHLSYRELNQRANRLAHQLIRLGVQTEDKVGIAIERSVEMIVGVLGVLKAGAAYVPLDNDYPAERLGYMAQDSGIALLLTQSHLQGRIPGSDSLGVLELDRLDLATQPDHNPDIAVHGEHLAYVIYTSGSTGKPKGAAVRHAALHSCMAWMQQTYGLKPEDGVLHKAAFGFDVSCWEIFWPLTSGARLVVSNPGDHRDPARIVQLIRQHGVTTLNFVPSMLQAFLAHEGIEHTTRLRHVICGGEAMPAATQKETLQRLPQATLQNLYGPTETTIHVTQWTCRDDGTNQVPIGQPISATQAWALDAELNPVPLGVAGELHIGGISLARGYLNRAGLTSEKFIASPFATGERLYRTGDLVRWNGEGQLDYLGRIDQQIKIRGFRIELGEVEAQLCAQPGVREAVVVAQAGQGGERLVAYVVAHGDAPTPDPQQLRAALADSLPSHMVPAAVVALERLPLTANGKVDRQALPVPAHTESRRSYEAPQGDMESAVAAIWAEALGVTRVGMHDNFFDIGGHSLLLVRVHQLLRQRLDAPIAVVDLFKHATVRAQAAWLSRQAPSPTHSTAADDDRALRQRAALLQRGRSAERAFN